MPNPIIRLLGCNYDAGGGSLDAEIHARAGALHEDETEMSGLPDQWRVRLFPGGSKQDIVRRSSSRTIGCQGGAQCIAPLRECDEL